jgi:hypothetical protein
MPDRGNQSTQVVVGANGTVWVCPYNTAVAPTDSTAAPNTVFENVGFISEDGATFTEGKDITDINAWQSFFPIRRLVTGRSVQVSFALREWNRRTIQFALGGTVSGTAPGPYTYTPPSPSALQVKALILDWVDGAKNYRLYIPQGIVSEAVETTLARTAAADLPVTFAAQDPGSGSIYTLFTNDPGMSS